MFTLQHVIGIVPPEEYSAKLSKLQAKWMNNKLPDVIEPHITVKAQGGLSPDYDQWLHLVEAVCRACAPFTLTLQGMKYFGTDVLFLDVHSPALHDLHRQIVRSVAPSEALVKQYYELDHYIPHLTLGQTNQGLSSADLEAMKLAAAQEPILTQAFEVTFVRVYRENYAGSYQGWLDIPLGKIPYPS